MAKGRNIPSISVRSSSPNLQSESDSPSRILFSRSAIPSNLLCTASILLVVYLSRPENFELANAAIRYLPLFQIVGFVVLERLAAGLVKLARGSIVRVEWLGLGEAGQDETWLGKSGWRDAVVGGGLMTVELISFVEALSGLNNKGALSLISLSSPLLLINLRRPLKSPNLMLGLLLLFISNFSLLLSIASAETGIARHQQFASQIAAVLCAGARVGGEWWGGSKKGRLGGGRKGGLIAFILISIVTIIRITTSNLPSTGMSFPAFTLLLLSSLIFGLSILVPASPQSSTFTPSPSEKPLVLPALTSFLHISLVFTVLAIVTLNPINANHALLFGLGSIGEYLINPRHSGTSFGYDPISLAESDDLPPGPSLAGNGHANGNSKPEEEDEPEREEKARVGNGIKLAMMALSIAPAVIWLAGDLQGPLGSLGQVIDEVGVVRGENWIREADFDIVVSYYNEDLNTLKHTIDTVKATLPEKSTTKTIIYAKGPAQETNEGLALLQEVTGADEVASLVNVGREGETYLQHITRHHSSVKYPLATQTFFLQPHLAWEDVANARLSMIHASTGFISLGPYLNATCSGDGGEVDRDGQSFPRIGQIYAAFRGDFCPPEFLVTWAGQFLVSKKRIEANPIKTYQNLLDFFDVPKGQHSGKGWIWDEGYWDNEPSKPTLGYALERSWPLIFDCADPSPVRKCKNNKGPECECRDD